MSVRHSRLWFICHSRSRYRNEADAKVAATQLAQRTGDDVEEPPYRCPRCKGWHLPFRRARDRGGGEAAA